MVKILLVYEDFNELTLTESYLKKVGFDVMGISNEVLLQDQLLSFNPDIIVAHGKNLRVSSFSVGQKLKENQKFLGKVVIVVSKDVRPTPQEIMRMKMDSIVEAPIQPEKLIQVLCRLAGHPATAFLDKFQKARLSDPSLQNQNFMVESEKGASNLDKTPSFSDPERAQKYAQITEGIELDLQQSTHTRKDIREKQKELKKDWNYDKLESLDELKREFASALFRKK